MERRSARFGRQYSAFWLILSMSTKNADGTYILHNYDWIQGRADDTPLYPADATTTDKLLVRDMFYLFEYDLYQSMYALIQAEKTTAAKPIRSALAGMSIALEAASIKAADTTASDAGTKGSAGALWTGEYPHGCHWIVREVVSSLLG